MTYWRPLLMRSNTTKTKKTPNKTKKPSHTHTGKEVFCMKDPTGKIFNQKLRLFFFLRPRKNQKVLETSHIQHDATGLSSHFQVYGRRVSDSSNVSESQC